MTAPSPRPGRWRRAGQELALLDRTVYAAVQATPSPTVDAALAGISRAADRSVVWLGIAAALSVAPGRRRRAALVGLAAVGATSTLVNAALKPTVGRGRPTRTGSVRVRSVRMPRSTSHPSGHAASAFAFSTAVGGALPELDTTLRLLATTVAYSRVHTGVHYPGDVIVGGVLGACIGSAAHHLADGLAHHVAAGLRSPSRRQPSAPSRPGPGRPTPPT
jgi:undecaprenyl-diphosphatase